MGEILSARPRSLTPLGPQSRFGDKPFKFQVVCPQNGTAVLKGLGLQSRYGDKALEFYEICPQNGGCGPKRIIPKNYLPQNNVRVPFPLSWFFFFLLSFALLSGAYIAFWCA